MHLVGGSAAGRCRFAHPRHGARGGGRAGAGLLQVRRDVARGVALLLQVRLAGDVVDDLHHLADTLRRVG
jgi:hypothetical protein